MSQALFDAHIHLDDPAYDADRDAVLQRARVAGVAGWVLAGTAPDTWDRTAAIGSVVGGAVVLGIHPWWAGRCDLDGALAALASRPLAGIGEIGLDAVAARGDADRALQRRVFRAQLALARQRDVPVVIHCVRAFPELISLLRRDGLPVAGGMIHGWSGPADAAVAAAALGLCVSFGPLVCRPRARRVRQAAVAVPPTRLLVETDGPDQALPGHDRGEPDQVVAVLDTIAALRGQPAAELAPVLADNLGRLGLAPSGPIAVRCEDRQEP